MWVFALGVFIVYSPLVWIRRIEPLSKLLIFALAMILLGALTTTVFAFRVIEVQGGHGEGYVPLNPDSYWGTVGFAFFMYEGIGCLLPVVRETEKPEEAPFLSLAAFATLFTMNVSFASLCYYAWGANLTEPVVTEMLPADNTFVQVMKLLFCLNLVFSFPFTMVPTYSTIEAYFLNKKETATLEEQVGANVENDQFTRVQDQDTENAEQRLTVNS